MASTQEMQRRAKALKKASALKETLREKTAQGLAFQAEHPSAVFVNLLHTDKRSSGQRTLCGWVIPQAAAGFSKDDLLQALCEGFMKDYHLEAKKRDALFGAVAAYLTHLTTFEMGRAVGHDGIVINIYSDGKHISCRECMTGPAAIIMQQAGQHDVLNTADGVEVQVL